MKKILTLLIAVISLFFIAAYRPVYAVCPDGDLACGRYPVQCQGDYTWTETSASNCETHNVTLPSPSCNNSTYQLTYNVCVTQMNPIAPDCEYDFEPKQLTCSATDSCTSSWPYLNPGKCDISSYVQGNPQSACTTGSTIYKTCCNTNGTVDGVCLGGDHSGSCPGGNWAFCGSEFGVSCGVAACQQKYGTPPPTPTPVPIQQGCVNAPKTLPPPNTSTVGTPCDPATGSSCPVTCTKACPAVNGFPCSPVTGTSIWACQGGTQWFNSGECWTTTGCPTNCSGVGPTPTPTPISCVCGRDPGTPSGCKTCPPSGPSSICQPFIKNSCPDGCDYVAGECEYGRCTPSGCFNIRNGAYCGQPTQQSYVCDGKVFWTEPVKTCGGQPINQLCNGSCSQTNGPCVEVCSWDQTLPKYCHSKAPDDKTCTGWIPSSPVCGQTQTRSCKTTDCSNCNVATQKYCDCNYTCVPQYTTPVTCSRVREEGVTTLECTGGDTYNATDGCGQPANRSECNADKTISGNVFVDTNNNKIRDGVEPNYGGAITISSTGGSVSYPGGGTYIVSGLLAGTYTISYTNGPPAGYQMTNPVNGPPPSFSVTVSSQSITNINFAINNSKPWIQCVGGDCRIDSGFTSNIPTGAVGGAYASVLGNSSTTPGIIYSGGSTPDFGQGQASPNPYNWTVGGITDSEFYAPPKIGGIIKTSYNYLYSRATQSSLPIIDINTYCIGGISNCTLSFPADSHGIYISNGSLNLVGNGYTFPSGKNYVILVKGDLTINEKIFVPVGSTAVFSATGNINVDKTVGESSASSNISDLDGVYSADKSFFTGGTNNCAVATDLRLNVFGNIITNAGLTGGSFQNQRDICGNNSSYPSISISSRLDLILNSPLFVKKQTYTWQEAAP